MNCLFWNCRGTGSKAFPGLIRELCQRYFVDFLALVETRSSGPKARKVARQLGFKNQFVVDSMGFSGGIWICWKDDIGKLSIIESSDQFIHVKVVNDNFSCYITSIYASPNRMKRRLLWNRLVELKDDVRDAWCVGGDFNCVLYDNERRSNAQSSGQADKDFIKWVEEMEMCDVHSVGPRFTWKRSGCESRLDRVMTNNLFSDRFIDAMTTVLFNFKSDHAPILFQMEKRERSCCRERPFRFEASWVLHSNFNSFVEEAWSNEKGWNENLNEFTTKINSWSREVYGHLERRKRHLMGRIEGINKRITIDGEAHALRCLQEDLWVELEEVILQEDLMWAQKARVTGLLLEIKILVTFIKELMLIGEETALMHCCQIQGTGCMMLGKLNKKHSLFIQISSWRKGPMNLL